MEVFAAVRTVLAVREFQDKPVPPDASSRPPGSPAAPRTASPGTSSPTTTAIPCVSSAGSRSPGRTSPGRRSRS